MERKVGQNPISTTHSRDQEFKSHHSSSHFVAVSLQNSGSFSAPWHRVSSLDTLETAYLKARRAAECFQLVQFAICPFTISGSEVTAHPYNFHLFPRDELNIGMPSYSFSCQTSYLTAMARQGFDFNAFIYDEALVKSLRKLVLGSEQYGSRPCMTTDVCSERQVQLVVEMELQKAEEEQNKKMRGFREVIDLISASQHPLVSHNSLNDFSVIHSKFIAPLPLKVDEYLLSLESVFPHILDVNQLMKEIGPLENVKNISAAISYLKNRFFAPIDMKISHGALLNEGKIHGQTVVRICQLFAKLCSILKITPGAIQSSDKNVISLLDGHANVFKSCSGSSQESVDGGIRLWAESPRKVLCEDIVFLCGFRDRLSAGMLKSLLQGLHDLFFEEFDVCLVDKSCAIVVFLRPNLSQALLEVMSSVGISESLRELVSEGLRAAGYETYRRACNLGLWEIDLGSSLDIAHATPDSFSQSSSEIKPSEIYWCNDLMINLDDL
ncbi:hypothetical protein REPUB_Repub17cG0049400 [Reevesia pubescens]